MARCQMRRQVYRGGNREGVSADLESGGEQRVQEREVHAQVGELLRIDLATSATTRQQPHTCCTIHDRWQHPPPSLADGQDLWEERDRGTPRPN